MGIDFDFWNGKIVLITGHTGFKGSWLSIWLNKLGAKVIGYGLDPYTEKDNFVLSNLDKKVIDIRGNVLDSDKLKGVFMNYKPEIVFHLAAQPLVRLSYEIPKQTYETNVIGTLNVLECIRDNNYTKVGIMVTSDKCYENKEQIWGYRESDRLGGYDPYSSSKACAEILISSYRNSFMNPEKFCEHGKSISSVRSGNVIGGGDWSKDRIIPDCIKAIENNKTIKIRNPKAVRPWQHVLEPLHGYLLLAQEMYLKGESFSTSWNFGPNLNSIITVYDLVNLILNKWGNRKTSIESTMNCSELYESNSLLLDTTKSNLLLNWYPKFSLEETVEMLVDWYKNYKENAYALCISEIEKISGD